MLSYDGVIRKPLRLKNRPPITPYEERFPVDTSRADGGIYDEITPTKSAELDEDRDERQVDTRTEAQKRHDDVMLQREKESLRREASKSYKERVEVRLCELTIGVYGWTDAAPLESGMVLLTVFLNFSSLNRLTRTWYRTLTNG